MFPKLAVSIVLYKTPLVDLENCLNSLRLCANKIYIYLIDNSPTDELGCNKIATLANEYIHLPSNPGFGAGHNVAIVKSQADNYKYHLVLNADISFNVDVISPMLVYMENNLSVGQMMPKVLNPDGTIQRLCKLVPTPFDLIFRRFLPKRIRKLHSAYFELHNSGYNKIMFVPYLSGCFMLLRLSAIKQVGLFDERYFMYPEDIDLTRRMAESYKTIFFPSVSVVHAHGAASRKSVRMFFIHTVNLIKYFNKWGWINDPMRLKLNKKTLNQFF